MAFPASLPLSSLPRLLSLNLWPRRFGRQGSQELSALWDSFLSLWLSGGKTEGRRSTCPSAIARGFCDKPVKAWRGQNQSWSEQGRREELSLGTEWPLLYGSGNTCCLSVPVLETTASVRALQVFSWALWSPPGVLQIPPAIEIKKKKSGETIFNFCYVWLLL